MNEELENYIENLRLSICDEKEFHDFETSLELAELLTVIGQQSQALTYYESAFVSLRRLNDDFAWKRQYMICGAMYASTLDYLGRVEDANGIFEELIEYEPNGSHICDYSIFLHKRKKNFNKAEILYKRSLEHYPTASSVHLKYAGFLRHVKKDALEAEKHYKQAVETNDENADAIGSYASFLHGQLGDMQQAEAMYERAIQIDQIHANNLCNFGLFLSEEKKDYIKAEDKYKQALATAPAHANTLYNYAVMLDTHCRRKGEAEELYLRCLEADPRHPYALYNLAVLLEELQRDSALVLSYYERAAEADPSDATTLADYGRSVVHCNILVAYRYLTVKMGRHDVAEMTLRKALTLNPESQVGLYNLGLLLFKQKKDYFQAESLFRKLLELNKANAAALQQLGRLYVDLQIQENGPYLEKALVVFEKLVEVIPEANTATALCEYVSVASKYGNYKQKLRAIATAEGVMRTKAILEDKDIRQIVEQLRKASASGVLGV